MQINQKPLKKVGFGQSLFDELDTQVVNMSSTTSTRKMKIAGDENAPEAMDFEDEIDNEGN